MFKNLSIAVPVSNSSPCQRTRRRAAIVAALLLCTSMSETSGQEVVPIRTISQAEQIFVAPMQAGISQPGPVLMAPIQHGVVQPSNARVFQAVPGSPNVLVAPAVATPVQPRPQHVGSGKIDINNLSPEILNCDVCRQRLGLPPKSNPAAQQVDEKKSLNSEPLAIPSPKPTDSKSTSSTANGTDLPAEQAVRMLGSPGLISSLTAQQLAKEGLVVEEFKPPQTQPGAIQLSGLPLEVRQQFFNELDLPFGAKVMSANIANPKPAAGQEEKGSDASSEPSAIHAEPSPNSDVAPKSPSIESRSLGAPGITVPKDEPKVEIEPLKAPLPPPSLEQVVAPEKAADTLPADTTDKAVLDAAEQHASQQQLLEKQQREFETRLNQMQAEWRDRMLQADVANREALTLLERRTAEVSQLQALVQQQKDELAKVKEELGKRSEEAKKTPPAIKKEPRKKEPGKGRQPTKPTIDT